ncbi:MAG TPA: alpha/beta hydrolase [Armatimonadetes bacterium]|nr:alpha/beta hydrolase [Armatimonadota bacterium]
MKGATAGGIEMPNIRGVDISRGSDALREMRITTDEGEVWGWVHSVPGATLGVVMVGGAGGGVTGPASIYPELAEAMKQHGAVSLRLDYRHATNLEECVYDTLVGTEALGQMGVERVALIGWSFGGAVVITAGALSDRVVGVATIASQSYGTELAPTLSPRALLLLHGTGDQTLPYACSEEIYRRARDPKELEIYPLANHGLDEVRDRMRDRLIEWLLRILPEPEETHA